MLTIREIILNLQSEFFLNYNFCLRQNYIEFRIRIQINNRLFKIVADIMINQFYYSRSRSYHARFYATQQQQSSVSSGTGHGHKFISWKSRHSVWPLKFFEGPFIVKKPNSGGRDKLQQSWLAVTHKTPCMCCYFFPWDGIHPPFTLPFYVYSPHSESPLYYLLGEWWDLWKVLFRQAMSESEKKCI